MAGLLETIWPYIPPGFREGLFGGNDYTQRQPSPGLLGTSQPKQRPGLLSAAAEMSPGADIRDAVNSSGAAMRAFGQWNVPQGLLESAYVPAALAGIVLPGSTSQYRRAGESLADAVKVAPDLPIKPPKEDLYEVADSNFSFGELVGNGTVPLSRLSGGISSGDNPARIKELVEKMKGPDGYIERLIVDADGNVIEGQHRLAALRQMNVKDVPVYVIKDRADMLAAVNSLGGLPKEHARQVVDETLRMIRESGSPGAARAEFEFPAGLERYFDAALSKYDPPQRPGLLSAADEVSPVERPGLLSAAAEVPPVELLVREWASKNVPPHLRRRFANDAIADGKITDAQRLNFYDEVSRIQAIRNSRGAHKTRDPLFKAAQVRDLTVRLKRERESIANRVGETMDTPRDRIKLAIANRVRETMDTPVASVWSQPFRDRIKLAISVGSNPDTEIARATLDAITRQARKLGWQVRHSSAGRDGRMTSRYLIHPNGTQIRVSDHEIPNTPGREYNRQTFGGPRWEEFDVRSDAEKSWGIGDYMAALNKLAEGE